MPSASTTQETCTSPKPSTAGTAVARNGPTSTVSHGGDDLLADAELGQALLGGLLRGDLQELALVGGRAQQHAVGAQRRGDRLGVGVVLVQVGDERERGGAGARGRGQRGVRLAHELAQSARCSAAGR